LLSFVVVLTTTAWGYNISDVTVSPSSPTTSTPVKVTVTGSAPATNYHLAYSTLSHLGDLYLLDIYWTSGTGIGGTVMVPYTHEKALGTLAAGKHTVSVRSFCDGLVRDTRSVSFTVAGGPVVNPPGWPNLFWNHWWWTGSNGSMTWIQVQAFIFGSGDISIDFSLSSSGSVELPVFPLWLN
jgi:hypothetical protein